MKKFLSMILAAMLVLTLCSCGSSEDKTPVRVIALKGPTGMGTAYLMNRDGDGKSKNDYSFTLAAEPSEVSASIIAGNFDIAAIPVNLASVLYSKGADVRFLAVNTLGVLYITENGDEIHSVSDLRGKTIYATGKGATPQYVLEYILEKNGLSVGKDVNIEYLTEHAELASKLSAGSADIGMLPEPYVTSAISSSESGSLHIALDLTKEWEKLDGTGKLVQGVIVVRGGFYDSHKNEVEDFIEEYTQSVEFANTNIEENAAYCAKFGIVPEDAAKKSTARCNLVCISGEDAKTYMNAMLSVLYEANPSSVGGKLPGDGFYINDVKN